MDISRVCDIVSQPQIYRFRGKTMNIPDAYDMQTEMAGDSLEMISPITFFGCLEPQILF
jgi:hypothetical protein